MENDLLNRCIMQLDEGVLLAGRLRVLNRWAEEAADLLHEIREGRREDAKTLKEAAATFHEKGGWAS